MTIADDDAGTVVFEQNGGEGVRYVGRLTSCCSLAPHPLPRRGRRRVWAWRGREAERESCRAHSSKSLTWLTVHVAMLCSHPAPASSLRLSAGEPSTCPPRD